MNFVTKTITMLSAALLLGGCAATSNTQQHSSPSGHHFESDAAADAVEVTKLSRRATLIYDGGMQTINLTDGSVIADTPRTGLSALYQAGDNRHLVVSADNSFLVFDSGLLAQRHDDHFHYFEQTPRFLDSTYPANKPGQVTVNAGHTTLFAAGDGSAQIIETAQLAKPNASVQKLPASGAHNGFAVKLKNGSVLITVPNNKLRVLKDTETVSETAGCASGDSAAAVANAAGETLVIGCTGGAVIYNGGEFKTTANSDTGAQTTVLAGRSDSPIVLGGSAMDAQAAAAPTTVTLINTETAQTQNVNLQAGYGSQSLGRGPNGEALVLTADGKLQVIDQNNGAILRQIPVISPWQPSPINTQPNAIFKAHGSWGYITDPVRKELVVMDLTSFEETKRLHLTQVPLALEISTGK